MLKDLNDPAVYRMCKGMAELHYKNITIAAAISPSSLAVLYVNDKATKENLESFHIGLAGFMSQAIKAYLRRDLPQLPKQEAAAPVEEPVKKTRKKL